MDLTGSLYITLNLLAQRIERREFLLVANACDEVHLDMTAIRIPGVIE